MKINWKKARRAAQVLLTFGLLIFLARYVYLRWKEVENVLLTFKPVPVIVGAAFLFGFYILISRTWLRLLGPANVKLAGGRAGLYRVYFLSLITRYLPAGSLISLGSRVELFRRLGGDTSEGVLSVYYEQLFQAATTLVLAGLVYLSAGPTQLAGNMVWGGYWGLAFMATLAGILSMALSTEVIHLVARFVTTPEYRGLSERITAPMKLELAARFLAINAFQGIAGYFFLSAVYPDLLATFNLFLFVSAAYPLSRMLGQITAILPGGLGIREGLYVFILGLIMPVQPAILSAGLVRLASVLLELLFLAAASLFERQAPMMPAKH